MITKMIIQIITILNIQLKKQCKLSLPKLFFIIVCSVFTSIAYAGELAIEQSYFGEYDKEKVHLFTLKNANGMQVKIMNYGATITSIILPDAHGNKSNIAAGFDTFSGYFSEEYKKNAPYFGGIIGRYASFIKNSEFVLNDKKYQLANNLDPHHLHGGINGFDKRLWKIADVSKKEKEVSVSLFLFSTDGEESYPGNVKTTVIYTLTNENELSINYLAETDKSTPLSLTNHTYFNLNGFKSDILDHQIQIHSEYFLTPDETSIPDGKLTKVKGSAADFNYMKPLRVAFKELPMGFEHFYVFNNQSANEKTKLMKVAHVNEPASGRSMDVFSTEPGTLLYTGRYTSNELQREDGTQYGQFKAFCLETSKYPNGPNIKNSPRSILKAGEQYDETTTFKFSW